MDIEYLLWLQNFREATDNVLTPFMIWLSTFTYGGLLFVPLLVYWCISKRGGMFILLSLNVSEFLGTVLKMTFCVYRPFVRDSRIIPYGHRSSGYSFPSGHTVAAAAIYGGLSVLSRKKYFWFSCVCAVMTLLVMFARNYLGFHTPQDVIAGLIVSVIVLYAVNVMMSHTEHENLFAALGIFAVIAGVAYVSLKSYPEDYGLDGKLLVNAAKEIDDIYLFGGSLAGLIAGRLIERKYIRFTPSGFNVKGIILAAAGCSIYSLLYFTVRKNFVNTLAPLATKNGGVFVHAFVSMIFAVVLWPLVIKKVCGK